VPIFLAGDEGLGAALWLLHGLWFAGGFAVMAVLTRAIRRRGWPIAVAGVAPLLVVEWLHPQLFPVYAGAGLVGVTPLVQIADLGGPLLLTALVGSVNAAAFETLVWLRGKRPLPLAALVCALSFALLALLYGRLRTSALEQRLLEAPELRVGVVQANLGVIEKRTDDRGVQRAHLEATRALLEGGPLDLVIWPETALPRALRGPLPISGRLIRRDLSVPLLFGGTLIEVVDQQRVQANAALLVDAEGMIRQAYRKNLLIPLAESVPLRALLPWLEDRLPHAQAFRASEEVTPLQLGPWRIATPICYEAVRPAFVRRMVEAGAPHLLVTLANDAWFGDSQEPWLHLQLARLRAVEQRRYLVRATNSGISAIVDPLGRIVAHTHLFTRETLRGEVRLLEGLTPYARVGDWPGALGAALAAFALARRRR
jgi:apolipoprotein N-acyltransferase